MAQIHLIRHGQASFDADDYDQLSPLGERQARHLGAWFGQCARPVHALHLGGMKRHRQTAEQFVEGLPASLRGDAPMRVDAGWNEYDHDAVLLGQRPEFADRATMAAWGRAQQNPRRAFQALFAEAMQRWMSGLHDADYPESWTTFRLRCLAALQRSIDAAGTAKTLVIVTSGGPISAICQSLLDLSDERTRELCWSLANSGVTSLFHSDGKRSLAQLNNIAHLESLADPVLITYR